MNDDSKEPERRRLEEVLRRMNEIVALLGTGDPKIMAEFFRLCREFNDLGLILGEVSGVDADAYAKTLGEQERIVQDGERMIRALNREPTATERVMIALSKRLEIRQGTIMPDFDAIYRRKAELDNDRP